LRVVVGAVAALVLVLSALVLGVVLGTGVLLWNSWRSSALDGAFRLARCEAKIATRSNASRCDRCRSARGHDAGDAPVV